MILIDVSVLVYAHREDAPNHSAYRRWLEAIMGGDEAYAVADIVLSGVLRVVTHPRIFNPPSPLESAQAFVTEVRHSPNAAVLAPGARHWDIFARLCREAGARGNLIPDAYLAALAIETGCEWLTTDRDFARFDGLRWRHPLS